MEKFKKLLPTILMIIFELAVGILLLINGEQFTIIVLIAFGAILIVSSVILLIRYLKERKAAAKDPAGRSRASVITLIAAVIIFIFGAVFAFGSSLLYGLMQLVLIFYGAVMIVKGVFKIVDFISLRKEKYSVSVLHLVIGILSILLGGLIVFNPFGALYVVYTITGIYLIAEAVLDIVALILSAKKSKALKADAVDEDDEAVEEDDDSVEEVEAEVIDAEAAGESAADDENYDLDNFE